MQGVPDGQADQGGAKQDHAELETARPRAVSTGKLPARTVEHTVGDHEVEVAVIADPEYQHGRQHQDAINAFGSFEEFKLGQHGCTRYLMR
ncbi:hypothetical protein D3C72_1526650 [compost metagenome]